MTHTYQLTGMTCSSCEARVKEALLSLDEVTNVTVSKNENEATITMSKHIPIEIFQNVLDAKYKISEIVPTHPSNDFSEINSSWFQTYKPVLLIFLYITIITLCIQFVNSSFDFMQWMRHFMAGFFLIFSFFKLLNLKDFASSYAMYDIIAKKIPAWSYIYAFLEFALGIAFLINFHPILTNTVTSVVMTVSIIGVLQSVLNKKKIRCACLGAVFNLPMSTITIIEDGLMIVMSIAMLIHYFG